MFYDSKTMENAAALSAAERICAAIRTAPKAKGIDLIRSCVLTGEDIQTLADELERLGNDMGLGFFLRDAKNLREVPAVVLVGTSEGKRGLGAACGYCHFNGCEECEKKGGACVYDAMDLGIALGSAAATAADMRVDSRIMFSIGRAAASLKLLGEDVRMILALPLSVTGKSPFFDRKSSK